MTSITTTQEASSLLGVSEQRIRQLIRDGAIVATPFGNRWLVDRNSLIDMKKKQGVEDRVSKVKLEQNDLSLLSFFSGALGLDLGLEKCGFRTLLTCEIEKNCRETIVTNRPNVGLIGDLNKHTKESVLDYAGIDDTVDIDLIAGGPPCQAFSTAGSRKGLEDDRGNVFLKYVELASSLRPKYIVIENVRGLLSTPLKHIPHAERNEYHKWYYESIPGGALNLILEMLSDKGYTYSFNLYNTSNFGVPQSRERVVIICSRSGTKVPYLKPTHSDDISSGLQPYVTLRDAIGDLSETEAESEHFPPERIKYYKLLKAGEYWKNLPVELQKEALGNSFYSGGGKTGFYRRLSWNKPSCTLVTSPTMPATDICHPTENRPLSIQEYMRIQQFPDDWYLHGKLKDRYRQIGNAVPVGLGEAIGKAILDHLHNIRNHTISTTKFSRYNSTDEDSWKRDFSSKLHYLTSEQKQLFDN